MKLPLDINQLNELGNISNGLEGMFKTLGNDGKQIEAFWNDFIDCFKSAKNQEQRELILGVMGMLLIKARSVKLSLDPFKPVRIQCDDIARLLNFERYKKLRNLK